jgi:hypothetical protein
MAENVCWICILREKTTAKKALRAYISTAADQNSSGELEAIQNFWRSKSSSGDFEELIWMPWDDYARYKIEIGGDYMLFPAKWEILTADLMATTKATTKTREPDHAPFYWDLRDGQGNLKVKGDDAMAAVRAMSNISMKT